MKVFWEDIKNDLLKAEEPLSDGAWSKMATELNKAKPKRKFPFFYFFSIVGLLLLGFGIGAFINPENFFKPNIQSPPTHVHKPISPSSENGLDSLNQNNNNLPQMGNISDLVGQENQENEQPLNFEQENDFVQNSLDKNFKPALKEPIKTSSHQHGIDSSFQMGNNNLIANNLAYTNLKSKPLRFSIDFIPECIVFIEIWIFSSIEASKWEPSRR